MDRHDAELEGNTGKHPQSVHRPRGDLIFLFSPFMARAALVSPLDANLGLPVT